MLVFFLCYLAESCCAFQSFDGLCSIAKSGDASTVDTMTMSIPVNPEDKIYNVFQDTNLKSFSFGHGVGKNLSMS